MASGSLQPKGENKWRIVITLGRDPRTGKYPQITSTFYGTKKQAESEVRRLLGQHEGASKKPTRTTVAQLLDQWLDHIEARGRSDSTIYNYRNRVRHDIVPTIGHLDVRKLTVQDLDHLYTTMGKRTRRGSKTETIRAGSIKQVHAIIRAALNYAIKRDLVDRNVATHADPPTGQRANIDPPGPDEAARLLAVAYKLDPELGMALRLSATTGARRGSIVALRESHISFTDATIDVKRAVTAIPGKPVRDKELKAGRGGPVPLDPETLRLLEEHIVRLHQRAQTAGTELVADHYLFSTRADCATPLRPDALTTGFMAVRKTAGMPTVRLHDLRHFVPTTLMAAGFDAATLADRLKHSSAKMTLDTYSHAVTQRAREAGDTIGRLLDGGRLEVGAVEPSERHVVVEQGDGRGDRRLT